MMREIKFRCWDKYFKRWLNSFMVDPDGNVVIKVTTCWETEWETVNSDEVGLEVMQFTGLYDKHKKPIYEGDIVASNKWCINCEVYWNDNDANFAYKGGDSSMSFGYETPEDAEVIGNVYQNPELLNEVQS